MTAVVGWPMPLSNRGLTCNLSHGVTNEAKFYSHAIGGALPMVMMKFNVTHSLLPGQTRGYGRKSTASENAGKSLNDQADVILEVAAEYNIPMTREDIALEKPGHGADEFWLNG